MNKYEWHDKVMTAGLGDAQTLAIAGYIFYRHNERTGDAFPSLATMAKDLGISVATAVRWVSKLEKAGYLTHKRGGTGKSNRYYLAIPTEDARELDYCERSGGLVIQMPTEDEYAAYFAAAEDYANSPDTSEYAGFPAPVERGWTAQDEAALQRDMDAREEMGPAGAFLDRYIQELLARKTAATAA